MMRALPNTLLIGPGAVIGPTESVMEFMGLSPQHDEHCKAWRWNLYMRAIDLPGRQAAVQEAVEEMIAARRARTGVRMSAI
jgi:hypothetical protein